jgi:hypothetical protein
MPALFEVVSKLNDVATWVAVTLALGITAPDESLIVPWMLPLVPVWPTSNAVARQTADRILRILNITLPFGSASFQWFIRETLRDAWPILRVFPMSVKTINLKLAGVLH